MSHSINVCPYIFWIFFPTPPQSNRSLYVDLPPSHQFWPPPRILCPSLWGGGGGGVVTIYPSRNSASAIIYISPTRVTTFYTTKSCAVPMVLSLQVSDTVSPAPFPVFPVGSLISATIEIPLRLQVHDVPVDPDVVYHCLLILSPHRRIWARAGPYVISLWEEA